MGGVVVCATGPLACLAQPLNDLCAAAVPVPGLPFRDFRSTAGATPDVGITCNPPGQTEVISGIWYTYTAAADGTVSIRQTWPIASRIAVFTGPCTELHEVACSSFPAIELPVEVGVQYRVLVSAAETPGPNTFYDTQFAISAVPANDTCAGATVVQQLPLIETVALGQASDDLDVACNNSGSAVTRNAIWYRYVPEVNGRIAISASSLDANPIVAAFRGGCAAPVPLGCQIGGPLLLSAAAGETYLLLVGDSGVNPVSPESVASVRIEDAPPLPNETCQTARVIVGHFVDTIDTRFALNDGGPAGTCNTDQAMPLGLDNSVWYTFVPDAPGTLTGSITGDGYPVVATLYSGNCDQLVELVCYNQTSQIVISVPMTVGATYTLAIGDQGVTDGGGVTGIVLNIPALTGACCAGAVCLLLPEANCSGPFRRFLGLGAACNLPGDVHTPCCRADFNRNEVVSVQDVFDFLGAFFAGLPDADIDQSGFPSVQDIFSFLNAYFSGC